MKENFETLLRQIVAYTRAGMLPANILHRVQHPEARQVAELHTQEQVDEFLQQHPHWSHVLLAFRAHRASGLKLVPVLESEMRMLARARAMKQQLRSLAVAGQATAVLIGILPLVVLLGSQLSGAGVLSVVFRHPIAFLSALTGAVLILLAVWWLRRVLQRASNEPEDPGFMLELCAYTLQTGLSLPHAITLISTCHGWVLPGAEPWPNGEERKTLERWQEVSRAYGIPLQRLMLADIEGLRDQQKAHRERELNLVPFRMLFPIGLLGLPGFIFLSIIPVALTFLLSTAI